MANLKIQKNNHKKRGKNSRKENGQRRRDSFAVTRHTSLRTRTYISSRLSLLFGWRVKRRPESYVVPTQTRGLKASLRVQNVCVTAPLKGPQVQIRTTGLGVKGINAKRNFRVTFYGKKNNELLENFCITHFVLRHLPPPPTPYALFSCLWDGSATRNNPTLPFSTPEPVFFGGLCCGGDKGEALGSTMLAYKHDLSPSCFLSFFPSSNIYL